MLEYAARRASEIEIDHLAHDHDADEHPDRAAREHHAPHRVRPEELDVLRAGDVDEGHHRQWQRADDGRGCLRLHRHRLDLGFHLLAVTQDAGQVSERFRQIAAGLLLDANHDSEEVRFRHRNALVELAAGLSDRDAEGLGLENGAELALERLGRVAGDDTHAVEQREAGLDAAHDDVDRVGKRHQELRLAPLLEILEQPHRQAEGGRERHGEGGYGAAVDRQNEQERGDAENAADDHEALLRPGKAGLLDLDG